MLRTGEIDFPGKETQIHQEVIPYQMIIPKNIHTMIVTKQIVYTQTHTLLYI